MEPARSALRPAQGSIPRRQRQRMRVCRLSARSWHEAGSSKGGLERDPGRRSRQRLMDDGPDGLLHGIELGAVPLISGGGLGNFAELLALVMVADSLQCCECGACAHARPKTRPHATVIALRVSSSDNIWNG